MKLRVLGEKNPNYGKPRTEETKKKIREANKIAQLGRRPSEETKIKMRKSHQRDIPIRCVETGVIYSCPSEAGASVGKRKNAGHISEVCSGKRQTAFGYHWEYVREEGL